MMNLRFISSCTIDDVIYFTIINRGKSLQQLVPGLWHIGFVCVLPTNSLGWWLRAIRGRSGRVEGILQLPTPKSLTPGLRPKPPDAAQDRGCSARQRRYCQYCRNGAWALNTVQKSTKWQTQIQIWPKGITLFNKFVEYLVYLGRMG